MWRVDVADRLVVDRLADALVEQGLDERAGRAGGREPPDGNGPVEARGLTDAPGKSELPLLEEPQLGAEQWGLVAATALEEQYRFLSFGDAMLLSRRA